AVRSGQKAGAAGARKSWQAPEPGIFQRRAGAGEDQPEEEHPGKQLVVSPGLVHLDLDPLQRIYLGHDSIEAFGITRAVVLAPGPRRERLERRFVPSSE